MIKVLFFAVLRERLGTSEVAVEDFHGSTVADLIQHLEQRSLKWHQELASQDVLAAVNQQLVSHTYVIEAGDEVAFFPPVTGG
ncbi:MAG: molybdopterin converting factor subunit 1 [Aliidiomarina sp.]|uniref:molybdopterin converting factor subunit 1 n=1 Tax=Aliidiomarina sp. TaxID=1872439 RepID=UPI0025C4CF44|nr:molybdopterin converting factor subunit 1 [Aliidiomarina sp.]MCH8501097.1 molybdopterin converting factor subunit 1 [Aliidiomarina sp.]